MANGEALALHENDERKRQWPLMLTLACRAMTIDRSQQIARLYHAALARDANEDRRFSTRRVKARRTCATKWNRC